MNREEFDITHIKEEQLGLIPTHPQMVDPLDEA